VIRLSGLRCFVIYEDKFVERLYLPFFLLYSTVWFIFFNLYRGFLYVLTNYGIILKSLSDSLIFNYENFCLGANQLYVLKILRSKTIYSIDFQCASRGGLHFKSWKGEGVIFQQVRHYSTKTPVLSFDNADKDKLEILLAIKGKSKFIDDNSHLSFHALSPYFVTGFTDGEGSFMISIIKAPQTIS
jgi:hypothetical protein